jgi:hypothetical protein
MELLAMLIPRKFSSPFCGNSYRSGVKDYESGTVINGTKCMEGLMKICQFVETALGTTQYTQT